MIKRTVLVLLFCAVELAFAVRASASQAWYVEGTPRVVAQDIQFANGDVHLSGTVYLPAVGDHLPGIVALHGASEATRDSGLFRHLCEGLPAIGFAVLIYDRRGSGKSSGSLKGVDYETLADDAIAGQHALQKIPRVDPNKVGFWGLSQGGWLAVLAAGRSQSIAFAISVSAPLVTPEQQMQFATTNLLTVRGYSHADVQQMLDARRAWVGYLRGTNSREEAVAALQKAERQPWFDLAFMPKPATLTVDPEHNSWRKEMDDDLIAAVRRASVPLLFIYGGADPWIPVAQSIQQLQSIVKQQSNVAYAVIADANHEMMRPAKETMAFDAKTLNESTPQAAAYFMLMTSWLCQHVR